MRWIHYVIYGEISQQIVQDYNKGMLSDTQRALLEPREPETLYDLEADPWETNNLINDPAFQKELRKMRKALDKHLLEVNDVLFLPEYSLKTINEEQTPYVLRTSGDYELKNAWETIRLAGFRGVICKEQQLEALSSSDTLERYWAAVGLKSQVSFSAKEIDIMTSKLEDSYAPSAIYLASVVYDQTSNKKAFAILKNHLFSPDPDLALLALHNIHHMDKKRDFLEMVNRAYEQYQDEKSMELARKSAEVLLFRIDGRPLQMDMFW